MLFKINEEMEHSPYRVLNANDEADMLRARVLLSRSKEQMCIRDRGREEKNSAASSTVRASAWAMDFPFQVISSVSLL